jgi:hypothetical protein
MGRIERLHGTTDHLQTELRMTRVSLLRVRMLLDQYDAVCASVQDTISRCGQPLASTFGTPLYGRIMVQQYFRQQATLKTHVHRLLSQTEQRLEECDSALEALQTEVHVHERPPRARPREDQAEGAWSCDQ